MYIDNPQLFSGSLSGSITLDNAELTSTLLPSGSGLINLGSDTRRYGTVFASGISASNIGGTFSIDTSSISNFDTHVSAAAADAGFTNSGGGGSYTLTNSDIQGLGVGIVSSSGDIAAFGAGIVSSSFGGSVTTASIADFDTHVSAAVAEAGFGSGGGGSYTLTNSDIQGLAVGIVSSSGDIAAFGAGIVSSSFGGAVTTSSIANFDSHVSASVASAGFGSGGGGGATEELAYNNTVRYYTGSASDNYEIVYSGTVKKNLSWSRSGTTLTVTHNSHGLSAGDYVHVRNMGDADYEVHHVATSATNTFTLTVANSGATSGTAGAYVAVPRITTLNGVSGTVTFANPSGNNHHGNIQTAKIYFNNVEATTVNINVPAGIEDGFGTNGASATRFVPLVTWYKVGTNANPVITTATTITYSRTSNHARYTIGGGSIDTFASALCMLRF